MNLANGTNTCIFSDDKYQKDSAGKSPGIACDKEIDIGFFLRLTKRYSKFQKKKQYEPSDC